MQGVQGAYRLSEDHDFACRNACQQADGRAGPVPKSGPDDKEDPRVDDDIASRRRAIGFLATPL